MAGSPAPAPAPSAASKAKSKKRKVQDDSQPPRAKKQKASKYEEDEELLDLEAGVNTALVRMDPQLLADYVARQTKRFGTDLSTVELSDLYINANAIRDTTDFTKVRVKENLPDFLEEFAAAADEKDAKAVEKERKRLGDAPPKVGAPHTIIVTGAGLRAADLVRVTRKFQKKGHVVSKLVSVMLSTREGERHCTKRTWLLTHVDPVRKTFQG
jgi:protein CMS1